MDELKTMTRSGGGVGERKKKTLGKRVQPFNEGEAMGRARDGKTEWSRRYLENPNL